MLSEVIWSGEGTFYSGAGDCGMQGGYCIKEIWGSIDSSQKLAGFITEAEELWVGVEKEEHVRNGQGHERATTKMWSNQPLMLEPVPLKKCKGC